MTRMSPRRIGLLVGACLLSAVRSQRGEDVEWIQPQCGSVHKMREGYGRSLGLLLDEDSLQESRHLLPVLFTNPATIYALVFNASGVMKAEKVRSGWPGVEAWMTREGMYEEEPLLSGQRSDQQQQHRGGAAMYALLMMAQELPQSASVALFTPREPSDTDLANQAQTLLIEKNIPVTVFWTGRARNSRSSLDELTASTGGTLQQSLNQVNSFNTITLLEAENLRGVSHNRIDIDSTLDDLTVTIRGNISSALLLPPEGNGYHLRDECQDGEYRMTVSINGRIKGAWNLDVRGRDLQDYNVTVTATSHLAEWATLLNNSFELANNSSSTGEQFNKLTQIPEGTWQPFSIDVDLGSELTAQSGQRAVIYFKVKNNRFQPVYYDYTVQDKYRWVRFGNVRRSIINGQSEDRIKVDIQAPYSSDGLIQEPDIVTFTAFVPTGGSVRQSAYFRIGQTDYDSTSPSISYSYIGDCSNNLNPNKCSYRTWGANITIQDTGSGLLQVTSTPVQIELDREFIAGTKNPINARFVSSCCQTKVEIIAKDVTGNKYSRIIDVEQASWTAATISAVVLGSILLILIIVAIILLICWRCHKKRRSLAIYPNN